MEQNNTHSAGNKNIELIGWRSYLLPVFLVLLLFSSILGSQVNLITRTQDVAYSNMQERLHDNAHDIESRITGLNNAIKAAAPTMAFEAGYTQEQMLLGMNSLLTACNFDFVVRTNTEGIAFNYLGEENIDLSDRAYVKSALEGKPGIGFVASGAADTANSYVILATPIFYNGQVVGVLHGSYKVGNFVALLKEYASEHDSGCDEISILTENGTLVASSNAEVDSAALSALFAEVSGQSEIFSDNPHYEISGSNGETYQYFVEALDAENWNRWLIVSRMDPSYLQAQTEYARVSVMVLLSVAILITIALLYVVIGRQKLLNEQQHHSAQLADALKAAEKADSAKSQFLSSMSHEIRTPLNAIIGYNTMVLNEISSAKTDEERKTSEMKLLNCLTKSELASKQLLTIINDVLDMSAIESGNIIIAHERFDFKRLIHLITALFYSQAQAKNICFEVLCNSVDEEWFSGDQMRLSQILTNILSNAIKFTPENGRVVLEIKHTKVDEKTTALHFEVTDTGIGMSPEYLSHIWTAFEQAEESISRRFGGTGLGMAITKNLVELMGGTISVESKLGTGTKFTVDLVLDRVEQPTQCETFDFTTINALVVDDDRNTCDYIKLLFDRCGARCTTVTTGQEALRLFEDAIASNQAFNLCLVDWQMPGFNGIDTVKGIRAIAKTKVPIIVISAYDYAEIVDAATAAGVDSFVSKPLFQSSLFDLLANISEHKAMSATSNETRLDFNGARIILAEDNEMNMEIAESILKLTGLIVDSAWNGREAVELFEKSPVGTYHAILMDIHMPEMDGHEATRVIRSSTHEQAKSIPIIAMTADAFAENVKEAYVAGMNDHISKPIDLSALFAALRKYIPYKESTNEQR